MNINHISKIAAELQLTIIQVSATASLLDDGSTVPFITRYRKEATGSLDEVIVTAIRDRLSQLRDLDKRRESILNALEERGQLTVELKEKICAAETLTDLEDIYLPYRPKRRTRATIAREKGLEPLAELLFKQENFDPEDAANDFIDPEKGVETIGDALDGARDIIAELVNEDLNARERIRNVYSSKGMFQSKVNSGMEDAGAKYRDYFDWEEPVTSVPSHRILAMRRAENEGIVRLRITVPEEESLNILDTLFIKSTYPASQQVSLAIRDGYKRLLAPSMETEIRLTLKKRADEEAIKVFADNIRQLLLASPLGGKNILAVDPGFRTGCKVCCLNRHGTLLHNDVIYPFMSEKAREDAASKVASLCKRFNIEAIAVGNGTAGRETEAFIRAIDLPGAVPVIMVNESGASIYSASEAAREELPDLDATVRGTVSIGRRLMDPLAELVKIDPKSIGVGQYQHDVDQGLLKQKLDDVVVSCVNNVGVEVNTASKQLLTYVSGLGPVIAQNIVDYRNEHGQFGSRKEFKKVKRFGEKAFEQAAGFLRISGGENPLDASAVHPESYHVVETMAKNLNCSVKDLLTDEKLRARIEISDYVDDKTGIPTLNDILEELEKPGRDPRSKFELFSFADDITNIEDLKPGMKIPGIVTNITAFGVFVDVGVHQDGLVHISQLADRYVKNPADIVKVHQKVMVTVLEVDIARKRISLSMKTNMPEPGQKQ
ncbi:MAG: RNA-binding transcriptional accessory protein [Candidatus Latescibacteria bacterium]|nr:RNA-binding transcriptional accessory protein [Candidatus Latescibacterota bacterium]